MLFYCVDMKVAIFGNTYRKETLAQVKILFRVLAEYRMEVLVAQEFYRFMVEVLHFTPSACEVLEGGDFDADLVLSIGGDGTFLNTASRVGRRGIPILGINTGRLGFLADVSGEEIADTFGEIMEHRYYVEDRVLLQVQTGEDAKVMGYALNEVAVLKQDSSSMLTVTTHLNEVFLTDYQADGLIVSTPTGSTAYSMSVGGPLVLPQSRNLLLSAVAPHSLNVRPMVVPDEYVVDLAVRSRSGCFLLAIDGRSCVLSEDTKVKVMKADYTIKVLKREHHTFYNTLRSKLMWGVDKRTL